MVSVRRNRCLPVLLLSLVVSSCGEGSPSAGDSSSVGGKGALGGQGGDAGTTGQVPSANGGSSIGGSGEGGTPPIDVRGGASNLGGDGNAGTSEEVIEFCGDGLVNQGFEKCDDRNTEPGDGCTAACDQIEAFYVCPTPGEPCVYTVKCGDGLVGGTETCDDGVDKVSGVPASGDGCDANCQLELGYQCPTPNAACRPVCGDGWVRGREQCDDGVDPGTELPVAGDGCDTNCMLESGWVCPEGILCRQTVCGDLVVEGSEQCDDGNFLPFDGCTADCNREPACGTDVSPVGKCASHCGDGILLTSDNEQCDDGNTVSGDGCSDTCLLENGFECTTQTSDPPDSITLPLVLRDFQEFVEFTDEEAETGPIGHPDMERLCCTDPSQTGIVQPVLGLDRKPVYAGTDALPIDLTTGKTYFDQWYRDVPDINQRFDQQVTLLRTATGDYAMNSATDAPWEALGGFFPLDDLGFGNEENRHNYHFTSEIRYWFEYKGGEELRFSGDDDIWVFINGQLALDIGGVHAPTFGMVRLGTDGHGLACTEEENGGDDEAGTCEPATDIDFQMTPGSVYEAVVFQAERHTIYSNYWLTLSNFLAGTSTCQPVCGDGVVTANEACDLGKENNTGAHGGCNPDCTLAPFCGDAKLDTDMGEECDDGVNTSLYGGCAPGCILGPSCGDGAVQPPYEQCDDGKNAGGYRECAPGCKYGPRCGDGNLDVGFEQCDRGSDNGGPLCRDDCTVDIPE